MNSSHQTSIQLLQWCAFIYSTKSDASPSYLRQIALTKFVINYEGYYLHVLMTGCIFDHYNEDEELKADLKSTIMFTCCIL